MTNATLTPDNVKSCPAVEFLRSSIMQSISRIAAFAVRRVVFASARTSVSGAAPAAFKAIHRTFAPGAAQVRFFSGGHG